MSLSLVREARHDTGPFSVDPSVPGKSGERLDAADALHGAQREAPEGTR